MNPGVIFGVGTMIAWGFWIVFGRVASSSIDPEAAAFFSYLAATIVTGIYVLSTDASFTVTNRGLIFASLAGVAAAIGVVSTFIGTTVGSTTIVATIGGMYFVTAAAISVLVLGEPLRVNTVAGVGLALLAILVVNQ